jgi:hypothetical protein
LDLIENVEKQGLSTDFEKNFRQGRSHPLAHSRRQDNDSRPGTTALEFHVLSRLQDLCPRFKIQKSPFSFAREDPENSPRGFSDTHLCIT